MNKLPHERLNNPVPHSTRGQNLNLKHSHPLSGGNIFDTMNQENQATQDMFTHMFGGGKSILQGDTLQGNAQTSFVSNSFQYGKPNKNQIYKK